MVNHWYADGKFISFWSTKLASGKVTGTWRVENNLRCITITAGVSGRVGVERCGPLYRKGDQFLTFNPDGSVHGIHTLKSLLE